MKEKHSDGTYTEFLGHFCLSQNVTPHNQIPFGKLKMNGIGKFMLAWMSGHQLLA